MQVWSLEDYKLAFAVLNNLKSTRWYSLPKKESGKSGALFNRLMGKENFAFISDNSLLLTEKALKIQECSIIQSELISLYTNTTSKDQNYQSDLVDIYLFCLDFNQMKLDLAQLIMASDREKDREFSQRHRSVQLEYLNTVYYILNNQKNFTDAFEKDIVRLSSGISHSVSFNRSWIFKPWKERLVENLEDISQKAISEEVKQVYGALITNLKE